MKKLCDLPLNTLIEFMGKKMVTYSRKGDYVVCLGFGGYIDAYTLRKTTLVKVLTKPLKFI